MGLQMYCYTRDPASFSVHGQVNLHSESDQCEFVQRSRGGRGRVVRLGDSHLDFPLA